MQAEPAVHVTDCTREEEEYEMEEKDTSTCARKLGIAAKQRSGRGTSGIGAHRIHQLHQCLLP